MNRTNRMNREQFYAAMARLDEDQLRKAMWTLYWRGSVAVRERIEAELTPGGARSRTRVTEPPPAPEAVLADVRQFVSLARSGAYMAGDRRVHHTERSRWRFTFRRLVTATHQALRAPDPTPTVTALESLIDLAQSMGRSDYFHSEDPVEAAGFVVSEEAGLLWSRVRDHGGIPALAETAVPQLLRWESRYGWTRHGYGTVSQKEIPLARVLADLLPVPDAWTTVATRYLDALDQLAPAESPRTRNTAGRAREERTENLATWHQLLLDQFVDAEDDGLLDRLVTHPALGGPELALLRARLVHRRGDTAQAKALVQEILSSLPRHPGAQALAREFDATTPADG